LVDHYRGRVNPYDHNMISPTPPRLTNVEFDVALVVSESQQTEAGGKLSMINVFNSRRGQLLTDQQSKVHGISRATERLITLLSLTVMPIIPFIGVSFSEGSHDVENW
ncbi:hypothetical protein ACE1BG_13735, partial [Aeromonas veronii]|uniref:hypothetical protein n=1 Tax=Aeromonas veronii TaxID=654 RepID=UPI0035B82328